MDAAQQMVQTRGYNAFSYADISAQLGIRKASIHYHFPSKKDLAKEIVSRYRATFRHELEQIDRSTGNYRRKLKLYAQLYLNALNDDGRMCLCGMLAAEISTLPQEVRSEVLTFFANNEMWLTRVLTEGRNDGAFTFSGDAAAEAQLFLAGLQGAMLMARFYQDQARFRAWSRKILSKLER